MFNLRSYLKSVNHQYWMNKLLIITRLYRNIEMVLPLFNCQSDSGYLINDCVLVR